MRLTHPVIGLLLLSLFGCGGERDKVSATRSEQIQPSPLSADLAATCDSATEIVRAALQLDVTRSDGRYTDSFKGAPRLGCRIAGSGSFAALGTSPGPVDVLDAAFTKSGWTSDLHHSADGPDGSAMGFRLRDLLCLVMGRWSGHDEEEKDDRYELIVECARDAGSDAA
jgi:hypothetical protein